MLSPAHDFRADNDDGVRKLSEKYGKEIVPSDGPIPAHLLGNMWAQQWGNIYPLLAPQGGDRGYDLTKILKARNEAGFNGPLYQCSIYGNRKAGEKLQQMLAMGMSRPWPEALKTMTGEDKMDATAIIDYFAPLKQWLDAENQKAGNRRQ